MARISGVTIPAEKQVWVALTYIYGLGPKSADNILSKAKVERTTRVKNLTDGTGSGDRLNGAYFLKAGVTVKEDMDVDVLTGASGLDWVFFDPERDRVTD